MEERQPEERFAQLLDRTMDLMETILEDKDQFHRHLVKTKAEGEAEQIYSKVDTRALKEFVSGLKELRSLLPQEEAPSQGLQVIFAAGEEAFNE